MKEKERKYVQTDDMQCEQCGPNGQLPTTDNQADFVYLQRELANQDKNTGFSSLQQVYMLCYVMLYVMPIQ